MRPGRARAEPARADEGQEPRGGRGCDLSVWRASAAAAPVMACAGLIAGIEIEIGEHAQAVAGVVRSAAGVGAVAGMGGLFAIAMKGGERSRNGEWEEFHPLMLLESPPRLRWTPRLYATASIAICGLALMLR